MNKEDVKQMLMVIRIKEFVARKSLDKNETIGENEKMILSKLFANREYIADMVRLNRELNKDEEQKLYEALLEGFDIQLRIYFYHLFKEEKERCENCIKRLKFNMDEVFDFIVNLSEKCKAEEHGKKLINYLLERYGEGLY